MKIGIIGSGTVGSVVGRGNFENTGSRYDCLHQIDVRVVVIDQKDRRDVPGILITHAVQDSW